MSFTKSAVRKLDNLRLEFKRTAKRLKEIQSPAALQFDDAVQLIESVLNDKEAGPEKVGESFVINSIVERVRLICAEFTMIYQEVEFSVQRNGDVILNGRISRLFKSQKSYGSDEYEFFRGNLKQLDEFYLKIREFCEKHFQEFKLQETSSPQLLLDPADNNSQEN